MQPTPWHGELAERDYSLSLSAIVPSRWCISKLGSRSRHETSRYRAAPPTSATFFILTSARRSTKAYSHSSVPWTGPEERVMTDAELVRQALSGRTEAYAEL